MVARRLTLLWIRRSDLIRSVKAYGTLTLDVFPMLHLALDHLRGSSFRELQSNISCLFRPSFFLWQSLRLWQLNSIRALQGLPVREARHLRGA